MRKGLKRRAATTVAISWLICGSIQAAVTYEFVDRGVPSDGTTVATGFHGFTLRLTSDSGPITAVEFGGGNGIFGPFVQRWTSSEDDGNYDEPSPGFLTPQNLSNSALNFDSHFLLPFDNPSSPVTATAPSEDAMIGPAGTTFFSFPTNSSSFGFGSGANLRAAYGIVGSLQSPVMDIAYLVVPDGQDFSFTTRVATRNGTFSLSGGVANPLTWNPPSSDWNNDPNNQNWLKGSGSSSFTSGANVLFTDAGLTGGGGGAVSIDAGGVDVGNVNVSNTTGTYTFSGGPIRAIGQLNKTGGGVLVLNSQQSYAGGGSITGGKVLVNSAVTVRFNVSGGGILGGTGTIGGGISGISNDGVLSPGDGIGTITFSQLHLFHAVLDMQISAAGADRIVTTNTGLDGFRMLDVSTLMVTDAGGAHAGNYVLIDYANTPLNSLQYLQLASTTLGPFQMMLVNDTANTSIDVHLVLQSNWAADATGNWSSAANWSGGVVPDGPNAAVVLGGAITSPRAVTLDTSRTVTDLKFNSPNAYTINGPGVLMLDAPAGPIHISVDTGSHTIAAPMQLNQDANVTIASGSSLTISGAVGSGTSSYGLTKDGPGVLLLSGNDSYAGVTAVNEGKLIVNGSHSGGGSYAVSRGGTLSGSGNISGTVNIGFEGTLEPGDRFGTLTVGGLSLNQAFLSFDFSAGALDKIVVTNSDSLGLNGVSIIAVTPVGSVPAGFYTLIDYNGFPLANLDNFDLTTSSLSGLPTVLVNDTSETAIVLQVGNPPIPEPGSLALALVGVLVHGSRLRGRKSSTDHSAEISRSMRP